MSSTLRNMHLLAAILFSLTSNVAVSGQTGVPNRRIDCSFIGSSKYSCDMSTVANSLEGSKKVAVVAYDVVPTWYETAQRLSKLISDADYDAKRNLYFERYVQPKIQSSYSVSATRAEFMKATGRDNVRPGVPKGALDRLSGSEGQDKNVRTQVESLVRSWRRFQTVSDPEEADLVVEIRKYPFSRFDTNGELPSAVAILWPRRANPSKDNVLWFERFEAHWQESDVVAKVMRQLGQTITEAAKLSVRQKPRGKARQSI